jgi:hypothetical protein
MSKFGIIFLINLFIFLINLLGLFCFLNVSSSQTVQGPSQTSQSSPAVPITQDDVIRVTTELVQTDVTVTDKQGRFVDGLDGDKFELRINGKENPIAFFERVVAGSSKEAALLSSRRGGQEPASPVPTAGVKDLARIPVVGEFPLENFPTGQYELKIVVTDQANKKSASQSITFVVQ